MTDAIDVVAFTRSKWPGVGTFVDSARNALHLVDW